MVNHLAAGKIILDLRGKSFDTSLYIFSLILINFHINNLTNFISDYSRKKLLTHQIDNNKDNNTNIIETLNLKEYNYIDDADDDNHEYNKKS